MSWGPALFVLLGSLYFFLIYPLAAVYRCGKNARIHWLFKFIWILAIALAGPVAAALYFLRHPQGRASRLIAVLSFLFMAFFAYQSIEWLNRTVEQSDRDFSISLARLSSGFAPSVPPADQAMLLQHLSELRSELAALPWTAVMRRLSLIAVEQSLVQMHDQGTLSESDVRFWESLFNDRGGSVVDLELRIQTRSLSGDQI